MRTFYETIMFGMRCFSILTRDLGIEGLRDSGIPACLESLASGQGGIKIRLKAKKLLL